MRCQRCNEREATSHMTQIINGKKQELHLCAQCAAQAPEFQNVKIGMDFGIGEFLGGIFSSPKAKPISGTTTDTCTECKMTFEEFIKHGRLGCGECYSVFKNRLQRPLRQIHGTCEHIGKIPSRMGGKLQKDRQLTKLEAELNSAVMRQEFEMAAELRDKINELKKDMDSEV